MAKFIFRLQSFLNVKEKLEEQKKQEYGKALQKLEDEKQIKKALEDRQASALYEIRMKMRKGVQPYEMRDYNQFSTFITNAIKDQQLVINRVAAAAEQRRVELVNAMKERKTLETLKENDYESYLIEEKLAEQKIVDEIVSFQYNNHD